MTAREVLKLLRKDGWYEVAQRGSHIQMEHPEKAGKVSVPNHKGDIPKGTLHSIFTQAGLN
jgi:predicted RNA binding protein YcfA (HicA-like mRNA interferase family)